MGMMEIPHGEAAMRTMGLAEAEAAGGDPRLLALPTGLRGRDGRWLRTLHVRELTGADEEALFEHSAGSGAARVSALLARLIDAVPGWDGPIDEDFAARLTLGDRDCVLLRLRQLDLGDAVHQVARCPHCSGKVDVDLLISELPLRVLAAGDGDAAPDGPRTLQLADATLCLRWPTGADQQAVEALAADNPAAANTRLFARLVLDVDGRGAPSEDEVRAWPMARRLALAGWLQAQLPGPDLYLELSCPHCRADMSYAFDLHRFFLPSA